MIQHQRQLINLSLLLLLLTSISTITTSTNTNTSTTTPSPHLPNTALKLIDTFPTPSDAYEFVSLSQLVYQMKSCSKPPSHFPPHVTCHSYVSKPDGTQVMIVSSSSLRYIAIVYAGTDSIENWITDLDIALSPFGPHDGIVPGVHVHEGFNKAVFHDGLFDYVRNATMTLWDLHPSYRLVISGHSLGAADAILTAAALGYYYPSRNMTVLNYGCPRTGDAGWKSWVDSALPNVGIWRFVYRDDIVPRVPTSMRFEHVGHTVQLDKKGARAYYWHEGEEGLGYKGVPWNWESGALVSPTSTVHHFTKHYVKYIKKKSLGNPAKYFVGSFESSKKKKKTHYYEASASSSSSSDDAADGRPISWG